MKYRCISYPGFEPDLTWLRQVLLFVDEIHRIIPVDENHHDSDDLQGLMEHCENSVFRCSPEGYVEISPTQAEMFGKALDQSAFRQVADAKSMIIEIGLVGEIEVKGWEFLHIEKIGSRVGHELERRGMLQESPIDSKWKLVPRGAAGLVLSMLADHIARERGFDAITDNPMAFALNSLHALRDRDSALIEGAIASTVATVNVPRDISLLSAKEYGELRKSHSDARAEYALMVRELKDGQRLDRIDSPKEFRRRLDDISENFNDEMKRFRKSKAADKVNEWVPMLLTSLIPIPIAYMFSPEAVTATAFFSLSVNSIGIITKRSEQFMYPKVLQTLCAADAAAAKAAIRQIAS